LAQVVPLHGEVKNPIKKPTTNPPAVGDSPLGAGALPRRRKPTTNPPAVGDSPLGAGALPKRKRKKKNQLVQGYLGVGAHLNRRKKRKSPPQGGVLAGYLGVGGPLRRKKRRKNRPALVYLADVGANPNRLAAAPAAMPQPVLAHLGAVRQPQADLPVAVPAVVVLGPKPPLPQLKARWPAIVEPKPLSLGMPRAVSI
jgi:hypothetical protein